MTATYEKIATTTLGSGAADVTFSSIPATYTDLILIGAGSNSALNTIRLEFNGDTSTVYSETGLLGSGTSAISLRNTGNAFISHNFTDTTLANGITQIQNYSNTTTYKTAITRWNAPTSSSPYTAAYVGLWRSTAAINAIKIYVGSGTMQTGSTFTIYGIKAE
jgi:hypothetical protein